MDTGQLAKTFEPEFFLTGAAAGLAAAFNTPLGE